MLPAACGLILLAATRHERLWHDTAVPKFESRIAAARERIDPNTASVASLRRLPNIAIGRAQAIVQYRQAHQPVAFVTTADLQKVPGIGEGISRTIAKYLTLPNDLR
jgi:competence ComEA-like helix-hairpin-helix protein